MLLYKLLLIGGLCKDGFSSSSLASLECVWPRAGLSSPHVVKVVCGIADSSDSLGLLDKFEISHKCSQRKCLHLQAEKKEVKPAWPEDRCGVSTKLPSSVRQAFYLCYDQMPTASTPGPRDEFMKSTCQCCSYEHIWGERMPAFYYRIRSDLDAQNAIFCE